MGKSEHYCFTVWPKSALATGEDGWPCMDECAVIDDKITFIIVAKEIGDLNEGKHLQGYMQLNKEYGVSEVKRILKKLTWPRADCRMARGTNKEASDYVRGHKWEKKENGEYDKSKPVYIEPIDLAVHGEEREIQRWESHQGERNDIKEVMKAVADGLPRDVLMEMYPNEWKKYHSFLDKYKHAMKTKDLKRRDFKTKVIWCMGASGIGKTTWCVEEMERLGGYWEKPMGDADAKWWDGYAGQKCIFFDDFRYNKDKLSYEEFLKLTDRFGYKCAMRNVESVYFCSEYIFISSIDGPVKTFELKEEDKEQIERRIDKLFYFYEVNGKIEWSDHTSTLFRSQKKEWANTRPSVDI